MKRIRDQRRSDTKSLARALGLSAIVLGLTIGAGCGKVASGVGGESHFVCSTNASCAPHDGVPFCVNGYCQATADTLADASSGGSGGAGGNGIDSGSAPGAGGLGGGGGNAGSGGSVPMLKCEGSCCPTSSSCYADPTKGIDSPGSECLATHDNTGQDHVQLRQAWVRATTPAGNTSAVVYGVDSSRTQLSEPDCFQGLDEATKGTGGYVELIDLFLGGADLTKHTATIGYSTFVPATASALTTTLTDGLCFGSETYHEASRGAPPPPAPSDGGVTPPAPGLGPYALTTAAITSSTDAATYPHGLPLPMGLVEGWKVSPTKAMRLATDFDLASDRVALLAKLAADGEYGSAGFTGIFFYDDATGYAHGYAPLSWNVLYSKDGKSHLAIPVRETETKSTFNDPTRPNCIGAFRGGALTPPTGCKSIDPKNPAWGCYQDGTTGPLTDSTVSPVACAPGDGPATTEGYSLITELEQLYSLDLQATLCVSYPGKFDSLGNPDLGAGFYQGPPTASCPAGACCRGRSWDPTKADGSGIPAGDWCAATNSPATATCHDAWHTKTFQVFTGAKIRVPADSSAPMTTCAF